MKLPQKTQLSIPGRGDPPASAATLNANGLTCGILEPLLARHVRALAPGQVLEVQADSMEVADGIRAWARLTGNTLAHLEAKAGSLQGRYFLRKKTAPR